MKGLRAYLPLEGGSVPEHLAAHGVKPTRQRVMIARVLFERPQHVTAEQLLDKVIARHGHVAKATVYNTLNLFVEQGLVREVLVDREREAFEVRGQPELPAGLEVVGTEVIVRVRRRDA
jgi:Fur family iron response transcriptional regulator